ncbi:MAG: PTS IIA-like nitrogen-regulatory protein PtsN [Phenylobacterium sp. RIFCSPHIGHO2_01_FULL_69_31]|jgi:PTS system nitrogen regulatory IIA component|uniref:PTS IIA-like nitrogen regulatory protein PtsN n=1 Tax=Phenylobacterium sp. RIFCSPHIGHO2_01_FULL_69_31 TaxID=1801944 RepID=UPI0008B88859|nr:PTS IIA-like nitrogen regulatory protein PtsN [Phenylobacterium sp. RIFCSPHIGHO2_01_FULL_69_31]OHB29838.1 MAG: PTS IIA-like nitrogen-regulatory protein PtsN [Phenylobacterium sp. RIFCSPHIGHO2_01_FULL_69_31]
MNIGELLDRGAISTRVSAANKKKALAVIAEIAARNFGLEPAEVLEALSEREAAGSTGVGHGVGVPHARLEGLQRMRGVFVRLEQPVEFESVDDQPVDLLFALFAPKNAGAEHLRALARVSRLLRQADLREQLRKARSADAIHALLVQDMSARPAA